MNGLTSRQRKLVYLGGIATLLIPIIWLGMPAGGPAGASGDGMVGQLAQLRQEYDLGEATLGDVDPSSATMNLVLLGMRGIAANALWQNANEQQKTKEWAKLRATVDSIILLQPHFSQVWDFQGWNLAYNVSAVHDRVEDRWYWIKEGCKFTQKGTERNARSARLYSSIGRVVGWKVGESDEWKTYRQYFLRDPDTQRFANGPDPGIAHVDGEIFTDNYLAARRWYEKGNDVQREHPQQRLDASVVHFRHQPSRAQERSAWALQRDGIFGERTRQAWDEAHRLWTEVYGRESFKTARGEVVLNATEADILRLARQEQVDPEIKRQVIDIFRADTNYDYWRVKFLLESQAETQEAHRLLYQAKRMFREEPGRLSVTLVRRTGKTCDAARDEKLSDREREVLARLCDSDRPVHRDEFASAADLSDETLTKLEEQGLLQTVSEIQVKLEDAMAKYEQFLGQSPLVAEDVDAIEDGLLAVLYWRKAHQLHNRPVPTTGYPLEELWKTKPDYLVGAQRLFLREMQIGK
ncbi:MAG: hypothetical protein WD069_14570 [Planctomycetales bacterium]